MGVERAKQIVLLGPDCSGKSTLAELLSRHYSLPVIPNRKIKDSLELSESISARLNELLAGKDMILDQWQYPVDLVYEQVLSKSISPLSHFRENLEHKLAETDIIFVHVDATEVELRRRYALRGDELWDIEQIVQVAEAYREFMLDFPLPSITINTTDVLPEKVLELTVALLNKHIGGDL